MSKEFRPKVVKFLKGITCSVYPATLSTTLHHRVSLKESFCNSHIKLQASQRLNNRFFGLGFKEKIIIHVDISLAADIFVRKKQTKRKLFTPPPCIR